MRAALRTSLGFIERGARRRWIAIIGLAVVVSAMETVGALLIFVVINMITNPDKAFVVPVLGDLRDRFPGVGEARLFDYVAIAIAIFFVIRGILFIVESYAQNRIAYRSGVALSNRLVRGYLRMPYPWHVQRNSAEMIRNAYDSVAQIVNYVFVPMVALVTEGLVVVGMVVALLATAPLATLLAMLILGTLVFVLLRLLQPRLVGLGVTHQEMTKRSIESLQQGFHGVRDIMVLGRQRYFQERFDRSQSGLARTQYVRAVLAEVPRLSIETVVVLLLLGFLAVNRVAVGGENGHSLAVLGLFAYAVVRVMPAMNRLVVALNSLRYGSAAANLVAADLALLDSQPLAPDPETVKRLELHERLRIEHVSFRYSPEGDEVLSDIDIEIRKGESIGIVGPTGGGKSTLIDIVLGLLPPTIGRVTVDGHELADHVTAWHRSLGVVPQAPFLLDDTVRRNIALGVDDDRIDEAAVDQAVHLAQLDTVVADLPDGLDTLVGERGVRLSGGQRQRVAIARALYREPAVLVLDEGTSALDNLTEAEFIRALERLRGDRTILTVAHRLTTVRNCDRIVILNAGRVVDVGSYDDLVARNAEFRRMAG